MQVRINKASEAQAIRERGSAYVDAIKAAAEEREDGWWMELAAFQKIQSQFPILQPLPEPEYASFPTKSLRLLAASVYWSSQGFPVRGHDERERVMAICARCPGRYWHADGNFGLGSCTFPGCGCTKFKLYLKTQKCPMGLWE